MATSNPLRFTFHLHGAPTNQKLNEIFARISRALRAVEGRHGVARVRAPLIIEVSNNEEAPIQVVVEGTGQELEGSTPATQDALDTVANARRAMGDWTKWHFYEDFLGGDPTSAPTSTTSGMLGDNNWLAYSSAGTCTWDTVQATQNPGIQRIRNGAAQGAGTYNSMRTGFTFQLETVDWWTCVLRNGQVSTKAENTFAGFNADTTSYTSSLDRIIIEHRQADTNWYTQTATSGGVTRKDTGVAWSNSDWITVEAVHEKWGSAPLWDRHVWTFYIDGNQVTTHDSDVDYVPGYLSRAYGMLWCSQGTPAATSLLDVDLFECGGTVQRRLIT